MIQAGIMKQNCKPCRGKMIVLQKYFLHTHNFYFKNSLSLNSHRPTYSHVLFFCIFVFKFLNIESCDNTKCNIGKKCILKRGKPKCVCTPNCKASAMKKQQQKFSVKSLSEMRDSKRFEPSERTIQQQTLEMQNDEPTLIVANFNTRNANQRATINVVDNKTVQKNDSIEAFSSLIKVVNLQSNMSNDARHFENQLRNGFFNQFPPTKVLKVHDEFYIGTLVSFIPIFFTTL
jgi:hypothetical protein